MKKPNLAGMFSFRKKSPPKIDKQGTWPYGANTVRILVDEGVAGLPKGVCVLSKMSFTSGEVLYSLALTKTVFSEAELVDLLAQKAFRVIVSSDGPIGLLSLKEKTEEDLP